MARALTTKSVEALKADPGRRLEIPDPGLSGLYAVVQPSGSKSWALRYRFAGKPKKLTLGKWPLMGVAAARAAASKAIEAVELGKDPGATKKATKAARRDAQITERDKVKTLLDLYEKRHLSKLKSGAEVSRRLRVEMLPVWGDCDVTEISRRDVIDLLDAIADSGRITTANRVRAYMSKFFNWCVEREIIEISPLLGVKAVAKERSRDRVLSDDEIRWLWAACDLTGYPWGPAAQMLLLTGQRLGEVCGMTEREIFGATWHLASERTKNARAHDVPLSEAAQAVLRGVERIDGLDGYIFTTTGRTPVSGYFKARNGLLGSMEEIAAEERGEPVEIPHWTFHDLRRTLATGMARIGIPVRITEAVLNHVSGTGGGIVGVYQRHDYAGEKRQALEAWARFVGELVNGDEGNVVSLREAKL